MIVAYLSNQSSRQQNSSLTWTIFSDAKKLFVREFLDNLQIISSVLIEWNCKKLAAFKSRNSSVSIVTRLRTGRLWFNFQHVKEFMLLFQCPVCLLGPHNLRSSGYRGFFLRGQNDRGRKLTTHFYQVPMLRKVLWLIKYRKNFTFLL